IFRKFVKKQVLKIFSYKHTHVSYTDQGKGSALFFLHGFLESNSMWKNIAKELAKKFRVVCIDLLGHGQSGCLGYVHTMEDQADMIHALMSHLRLRKISRDSAIKAVKQNSDLFIQLSVSNLFMPESLKKHQKKVDRLIDEAKQIPVQGVIAALEGMKIRPDREVLLHFGPYPKLIIAG